MTTIKVSSGVLDEVKNLEFSADKINSSYKTVTNRGNGTFPTVKNEVSRHEEIKALLEQYKILLNEDAASIREMVKVFKELDEKEARTLHVSEGGGNDAFGGGGSGGSR